MKTENDLNNITPKNHMYTQHITQQQQTLVSDLYFICGLHVNYLYKQILDKCWLDLISVNKFHSLGMDTHYSRQFSCFDGSVYFVVDFQYSC